MEKALLAAVTPFLPQKNAVILSASEGSRKVTLGALFTGFFSALRFRMTVKLGEPLCTVNVSVRL